MKNLKRGSNVKAYIELCLPMLMQTFLCQTLSRLSPWQYWEVSEICDRSSPTSFQQPSPLTSPLHVLCILCSFPSSELTPHPMVQNPCPPYSPSPWPTPLVTKARSLHHGHALGLFYTTQLVPRKPHLDQMSIVGSRLCGPHDCVFMKNSITSQKWFF